jgi:hypothetical protein
MDSEKRKPFSAPAKPRGVAISPLATKLFARLEGDRRARAREDFHELEAELMRLLGMSKFFDYSVLVKRTHALDHERPFYRNWARSRAIRARLLELADLPADPPTKTPPEPIDQGVA